jgi:hypothetical protein
VLVLRYHWCHPCYQELKEANPVEMPDVVIRKSELGKKKNDEVHEESWVACDTCGRWIHQICGLFNTRQNKDQRSEYECPACTIKKRKDAGELEPKSTTPGAEDLPRTRLSEYLESHIREMSQVKFREFAKEKADTEKVRAQRASVASERSERAQKEKRRAQHAMGAAHHGSRLHRSEHRDERERGCASGETVPPCDRPRLSWRSCTRLRLSRERAFARSTSARVKNVLSRARPQLTRRACFRALGRGSRGAEKQSSPPSPARAP